MPRSISFTVNDDGSTEFHSDPTITISDYGALIVMASYAADRLMDAAQAARAKPLELVRAGSLEAVRSMTPATAGSLAREDA